MANHQKKKKGKALRCHLAFILPDFTSFPSGGNEYNHQLTTAIQTLGYPVRIMEYEEMVEEELAGIVIWDSLYLAHAKKRKKGKHYLLVHHLESLYPPRGWTREDWFEQKEKKHLETFDGFITTSPFTEDYLRKNGFGSWPIITIQPALISLPKHSNPWLKPGLRAIMVNNIIERKGILPFLKELANTPDFGWQLTIIGSSELEPDYAEACAKYWEQNPSITYLGSLPHQEVLTAYAKSNLFISTSFMETYGMSIQEASASGLPLLLMDGGNVKNHLYDGNGVLCHNIPDLVAQLKILSTKPEQLARMSSKAGLLASQLMWSWEDAGRKLEKSLRPTNHNKSFKAC